MNGAGSGASGSRSRARNRRGEGYRLRDDIVSAASTILERTESEDAVTLRAVAREIGIAAPSIAAHFADRVEIIDAVIASEAAVLYELLRGAAAPGTPPAERLLAICRAYVEYGRANPGRYRVLVGRRFLDDWVDQDRVMEQTAPLLADIITLVADTVQDCIDSGASTGTDAYLDTVVLWFAVHGLVTVPLAITSVPWPDLELLLATCVTRCARLAVIEPPHPA